MKLYAEPSFIIRRRRVLAFLYRCMATPQDVAAYIDNSDTQPWLPVPPDNFVGHDLDASLIVAIRKALDQAGMKIDVPLFGLASHQPWIATAAFVADKLDALSRNPQASAAIGLTRHWASLCAEDGAMDNPNETIATIAKRVAFEPDPRDVFPWVPRWGPAKMGPEDTVNSRPGLIVYSDLRRWWNFNAPQLRPAMFGHGSHWAVRHREAMDRLYMMPTSTSVQPNAPRVVASLNHVT